MYKTEQELNVERDLITSIVELWIAQFQPSVAPRLVLNSDNFAKICQRCIEKGSVTLGTLTASYEELAAARMLTLYAEPKTLTHAEQMKIEAEKSIARARQDYLNSIAPQPSFDAKLKAEAAKKDVEKAAKAQQDAETTLQMLIGTGKPDTYGSYTLNRKNGFGIDWNATATVQAELRTVVSRDASGKRDAIGTLRAVRAIILEIGDYPALGDVARALDRINARREQEQSITNKDREEARFLQRPR
jgi:hypothetical protein